MIVTSRHTERMAKRLTKIEKAAKVLKEGQVTLIGVGRVYSVTPQKYEVTVVSTNEDKHWSCTCRWGKENSPIYDIDNACYHILAVVTFDDRLMEEMKKKK